MLTEPESLPQGPTAPGPAVTLPPTPTRTLSRVGRGLLRRRALQGCHVLTRGGGGLLRRRALQGCHVLTRGLAVNHQDVGHLSKLHTRGALLRFLQELPKDHLTPAANEGEGKYPCHPGRGASPMLLLLCLARASGSEGRLQRLGEEALLASQSGKLTCQEKSKSHVLLEPVGVCGGHVCSSVLPSLLTFSGSLCHCRPGFGRARPGSLAGSPGG